MNNRIIVSKNNTFTIKLMKLNVLNVRYIRDVIKSVLIYQFFTIYKHIVFMPDTCALSFIFL